MSIFIYYVECWLANLFSFKMFFILFSTTSLFVKCSIIFVSVSIFGKCSLRLTSLPGFSQYRWKTKIDSQSFFLIPSKHFVLISTHFDLGTRRGCQAWALNRGYAQDREERQTKISGWRGRGRCRSRQGRQTWGVGS